MSHDVIHPPDAEAERSAEAAATGAGVTIRTLNAVSDLEVVQNLFAEVWQTWGNPPVTADLMVALSKAGSYVAGAFEDEELVGACVGFFAAPVRGTLHSHITGVLPRMQGRQLGFALKLHQRAWAMARGISEITWTYDPLISRNAYFNLSKLSAEVVEYLPDLYGPLNDDLNGEDPTDRVLVRWRLEAPEVVQASRGVDRSVDAAAAVESGARIALDRAATGGPRIGTGGAETLLVATPPDIEKLRGRRRSCASEWRVAQREVLGGLLARGARVRGFDRAGWYVVDTVRRPETS